MSPWQSAGGWPTTISGVTVVGSAQVVACVSFDVVSEFALLVVD